jgi:hypothetical protein
MPGAAVERSRPVDTAAASEDDREEARHGARPEEERADTGHGAGHGARVRLAVLQRCFLQAAAADGGATAATLAVGATATLESWTERGGEVWLELAARCAHPRVCLRAFYPLIVQRAVWRAA